jgi:hypothetical protein
VFPMEASLHALMTAASLLVTAKTYIKNPYLRAKFVEVRLVPAVLGLGGEPTRLTHLVFLSVCCMRVRQILFYFTPEMQGPGRPTAGPLAALLETHPVFVRHGVPSLTLFYQGRRSMIEVKVWSRSRPLISGGWAAAVHRGRVNGSPSPVLRKVQHSAAD